jgi:hypothetical protein
MTFTSGKLLFKKDTDSSDEQLSATKTQLTGENFNTEGKNFSRKCFPFQLRMTIATFNLFI